MKFTPPWRTKIVRLFHAKLPCSTAHHDQSPAQNTLKLVLLVEGLHDIAFLRGISTMLHAHDSGLPDLASMEHRGEIVFIPWAGVDLRQWTHRLAPLGLPEFHLYDREDPPETELRLKSAQSVNQRPRCHAVVTSKRSVENYLHPDAIREVCGMEIAFGENDNVAELIARRIYDQDPAEQPWQQLLRSTRTRRRNRVKRWLNRDVVLRMTPERLSQQDRKGEVRSWLEAMNRLIDDYR